MQASRSAGVKQPMILARKYGVTGIILFLVGFVLDGLGNTAQEALPVIPFADTLTALGLVLAPVWSRSRRKHLP